MGMGLRSAIVGGVVSAVAAAAVGSARARDLYIEHVTVVSPERVSPARDVTVRIHGDRIASVSRSVAPNSKADTVIDGRGLFLSPGLIDSHVHTDDLPGLETAGQKTADIVRAVREQGPRNYLSFGFTTLLDLMATPERKRAWDAQPVHPDFYFCGGVPIPGGYPQTYRSTAEQAQQYPYMVVEKGQEASASAGLDPVSHTPEAVVARMRADGAICVKTFYERGFGETDDWPAPRLDTIQALVKAAHAADLPVLIHANSTDGQEFAVRAGADIIAHGLWHWNREPEATELTPRARAILDSVLAAKMGWQPTMRVLYGERDIFDPSLLSDPHFARVAPAQAITWYRSKDGQWFHDEAGRFLLPKTVFDTGDPERLWVAIQSPVDDPLLARVILRGAASMRYMAEHHARILFGSDTPGEPSYANQPGLNGWWEMHLLLRAGLTPERIFRSATLSNAEALGLWRELGTVEAGKRANLLLTSEDPSRTIQAYDQIVKIILRGEPVDPAMLSADAKR